MNPVDHPMGEEKGRVLEADTRFLPLVYRQRGIEPGKRINLQINILLKEGRKK